MVEFIKDIDEGDRYLVRIGRKIMIKKKPAIILFSSRRQKMQRYLRGNKHLTFLQLPPPLLLEKDC